jgi:hypothetical protein
LGRGSREISSLAWVRTTSPKKEVKNQKVQIKMEERLRKKTEEKEGFQAKVAVPSKEDQEDGATVIIIII